ncbi:MAG: hypothetical protein ACKN9T_07825 [Candidatus Methylumidiphilus sp.]
MSRDLRIIEDREWFLEGTQYKISYSLVIVYALFNYLKHGNDKAKAKSAIKDMKGAIDKKTDFRCQDFLDIFQFSDKSGFVVIDKSKGCFPLVLYYGDQAEKEKRDVAFKLSLEAVIRKFDILQDKYSSISDLSGDWSKEFQDSIDKLFPVKKQS